LFDHIEVVTPPIEEPCTLAELKLQARVSIDDDDSILDRHLVTARERCERFTRRSLLTQTLDVYYTQTDGIMYLELPRGKVQSIVRVSMFDDAGIATIQESSIYVLQQSYLVFNTFPSYFRLSTSWLLPGIVVRIVSGYGDDPEDVPSPLRDGILEYATHLYDHPAGEGPDAQYAAQATSELLPSGVRDKWKPYQIMMV
jgi:uncharacterized phiE125 gp8 family phage protein